MMMMMMMMVRIGMCHEETMLSLCTAGDLKRVREIVEVNHDFMFDRDVEYGFDCAIVASRHGHADLLRYLVSKGASTRNRDLENQWTALMFAAHEGYVEIVKFLESVSPGSSAEALRDAAGVGDIDMMTKLLDMNTDPNARGMGGVTALMEASMYGHADAVRLLLSRGADVSVRNVDGMTALFVAVRYDHVETTRLLLDSNNDVLEITDRKGRTPLHVACENGQTETAEMMIRRGASLSRKSRQGDTPLFLLTEAATKEKALSERGRPAPIRKFLFDLLNSSNNVDVNEGSVDRHGTTALMFASMSCDLEIVKLFVHHGANVNAETMLEDGIVVNAFELAQKRCQSDRSLMDWLTSNGFRPVVRSHSVFALSRENILVLGSVLFCVTVIAVVLFVLRGMQREEMSNKSK